MTKDQAELRIKVDLEPGESLQAAVRYIAQQEVLRALQGIRDDLWGSGAPGTGTAADYIDSAVRRLSDRMQVPDRALDPDCDHAFAEDPFGTGEAVTRCMICEGVRTRG
jgi:hypothetical protein